MPLQLAVAAPVLPVKKINIFNIGNDINGFWISTEPSIDKYNLIKVKYDPINGNVFIPSSQLISITKIKKGAAYDRS